MIERIAQDREATPDPETRALAWIAAGRLPPALAGDLEIAVRADRPPHIVSTIFGETIDLIRIREQMARAFEPAP